MTKKIPADEYYLKSNDYEFVGESPFKNELENYVSQKPNKRLFGVIPAKDWAYNQVPAEYDSVFADYYSYNVNERNQALLDSLWLRYRQPENVGKNKWVSRQMFRAGAKPVTLDTAKSTYAAQELEEFYFERGYFDAEVDPEFEIDTTAQKAQVTYHIEVKEPSVISDYNQIITDSKLEEIYAANLDKNQIKTGERFDVRNFEAERDRLTSIFKNHGYFQFNELGNELIFKIDSTDNKNLIASLRIAKPESDSLQNFQQYYLGDINIIIDHPDVPNQFNQREHMGYNLLNDKQFSLKPRVYTDAITLKSGDLFRTRDIDKTRQLILDRENYNLTSLQIQKNLENPLDSILTVDISLRPKDKYNLQLSFETMYSQFLNWGISPGLRLLSRNIFKGGENLEFNLRGTVGTVNSGNDGNNFFNAYELSFETKLTMPRWLLPMNTEGLVPKDWNPKSSASVGLSGQKNIGLGSRNYSALIDYYWKPSMNEHRFELLNFQYIRNTEKDKYYRIFTVDNEIKNQTFDAFFSYSPDVQQLYLNGEISEQELEFLIYDDQEFINSLPANNYSFDDYTRFRNVIFRKNSITQDVVIQSFAHNYTYNENSNKEIQHPWFISAKAEVAGALLRAIDASVGLRRQTDFFGEEISMLGNVPYSEFVRLDLDVRKTFNLSAKTQLALRSFTGIAVPYGNLSFLPFSKSYFGGGSNDVRAWQAYALSPAPLRPNDEGTYIDQMKLTWNAEYRFPLYGMMNGAVFVDAGNIWSLNADNPNTEFKFNTFLSQLGVGSGFGVRFDFTFVVARLDFAYKIHNPAYNDGSRWFREIKILRPQVQFGINYPF
ncbi:MAG: BamA/TamA family outer membrane protein [Flavobacteriaceae bacterium]|nr:BamA/TamA family outer membrane protein [Flavobacteriaceae bacterium]